MKAGDWSVHLVFRSNVSGRRCHSSTRQLGGTPWGERAQLVESSSFRWWIRLRFSLMLYYWNLMMIYLTMPGLYAAARPQGWHRCLSSSTEHVERFHCFGNLTRVLTILCPETRDIVPSSDSYPQPLLIIFWLYLGNSKLRLTESLRQCAITRAVATTTTTTIIITTTTTTTIIATTTILSEPPDHRVWWICYNYGRRLNGFLNLSYWIKACRCVWCIRVLEASSRGP